MDVRIGGLLLLLPVAAMAVGDVRRREVGLVWLMVFAVLSAVSASMIHGVVPAAVNVATNILLLLYLAGGIIVWIRIRRGRWTNPLREYIGAGDVIFLAAATPLFDLRGYLLMLVGASVFSLIWWAVSRSRTIPFVATTGITLCAAMITGLL
jgi:hypothetical protein